MMGAIFPWDKILEPKGIIPIVIEKREEIADNIADSVTDKVVSHFPSISEMLGIKDKIAEIAEHLHQQALLTPDPNDDKIDFVKYLYDYVSRAPLTHFAPDWFKEMMIYLTATLSATTHNAVQWVFSGVYKFITSIVLWTPEWLFTGAWFSSSIAKFSLINMSIVIIFTMIQGIKRICKMEHSTLAYTMKRLPLAITVSAATPILFTQGAKWLNKLTQFIIDLGASEIANNKTHDIFASSILVEPLNILAMLAFIVLVVVLCVPMFIFHGRRWFNLLMQGFLTPFAMSSYLFADTEHYFKMWLNSIKESCKKQLIYAVLIALLGLIMFATPNPTTFTGIFSKMLITIGGIHMLAYPPSMVNKFAGFNSGKSALDTGKDILNKGSEIINKYKKTKAGTETALVGGASIAGKIFRFITKA